MNHNDQPMFHPYFKKEESCSQHPQSTLDVVSVHAFGVLLRRFFFYSIHDARYEIYKRANFDLHSSTLYSGVATTLILQCIQHICKNLLASQFFDKYLVAIFVSFKNSQYSIGYTFYFEIISEKSDPGKICEEEKAGSEC
jgi:hypothetical protein